MGNEVKAITAATTAHCLRCGRKLTAAKSRSDKYGPTCKRRVRQAITTIEVPGFKDEQRAKAVELIEAGGVVPTSRPGVFRTVGSSGDVIYLTHSATCACPAGLRGRSTCYHSLAVRLILAASVRRAA